MVRSNDNSLYNEDELHPPEWMNREFFKNVLKSKAAGSAIKITDFAITPGTTKSDHYASVMFRAKVNYTLLRATGPEEKFQSMIIKTAPVIEGKKKDVLGQMSIFETEIKMYTETLPKIEAVLRQHGDNTKLCAKCLYYALEPQECIVFDDLVEKGYTGISSRNCTMEEVQAALTKLAKIHAVSYKMDKEGDLSIVDHKKGILNSMEWDSFDLFKNSVRLFKDVLADHNDLRIYIPYIENIEQDLKNTCLSTFNAHANGERNGILVLNHGDFHMKNIMIKGKAEQLKDLMLVDYQLCIFGSVAIDLHYAFIMLLSPEMRINHRDELMYFYFNCFRQTLKFIEYNDHIPTMQDLLVELVEHRHWELFLFMSFLTFNYVFSDAEGDLRKTVEDESYRKKLLESPELLKELRTLLPYYLYRGYFEN